MDDIKGTPLSGGISGTIDCTSQKGKVFEVEVCTNDDARFSIIIPEEYMYIVNRAIEYVGTLSGMQANVDFEKHELKVLIFKGIYIGMYYSSADRIGEDIA